MQTYEEGIKAKIREEEKERETIFTDGFQTSEAQTRIKITIICKFPLEVF